MDTLTALLIKHEGLKLMPYKDTVGKLTIGVGRNLDDCGISQEEAVTLLANDIKKCGLQLMQYTWYLKLDSVRKDVLIECVFNMGIGKVLTFTNMIESLKRLDYVGAAKALIDSTWAKEVGVARSTNMYQRLLTGKYA